MTELIMDTEPEYLGQKINVWVERGPGAHLHKHFCAQIRKCKAQRV